MAGKEVSIWVKIRDGFTAELKRAGAMLSSMASGIRGAFSTLADIGKKAFLAIGVGIAVALREYHEFNKAMTRAESMIGKGAIKALRRDVLRKLFATDDLTAAVAQPFLVTPQVADDLYFAAVRDDDDDDEN